MNIVYKFILAASKRIEAKQKERADIVQKEKDAVNKLYKEYEERAEKLIEDYIDSIEERMYSDRCHLKPGDVAILNLYELDHICRNEWDTGPHAILNNVPVDVKRKPLKVRITDVRVSRGYYSEVLNRFLNAYYGDHLKRALDDDAVVQWFIKFTQNKLWSENHGLYWEANFEPLNFDFKPTWGLNAGSFLLEETNGAIFTKKYWKMEGKIQTKWEEINHEKKRFESTLSQMLVKYKSDEI